MQVAQDNLINIEGVSNDYLNGAYPGQETIAPTDLGAIDLRSISMDGDFDPPYKTDASAVRVDVGTGIPTLISIEKTRTGPFSNDIPKQDYFRPEGWTEQSKMSDVLSYDSPPGTEPNSRYVKMVSLDGYQSFYMRIDTYMS